MENRTGPAGIMTLDICFPWQPKKMAHLTSTHRFQLSLHYQHVFSCLVKLFFWANPLLKYSHLYGFSPVCVRRWVTTLLNCRNFFRQYWHSNFFSPRWIRLWICNVDSCRNFCPHTLKIDYKCVNFPTVPECSH